LTSSEGVSRRKFIQITGGTAGAAALAGGGFLMARGEDAKPSEQRQVHSFCELCFWKCGITCTVKDGRVAKIDGHVSHPLSNGRLCPRGNGGTGALYDSDRLKKPLIRTGKRGDEKFKEASWEAALDYTAEKLLALKEKHGPEALALFTHGHGGSFFKHLVKAYGSPNVAAPSYAQCRGPREVGFQLTFGEGVGSPEKTDIANTRFLVLIGSHLGENMHNTQVQEFGQAIRNGAKIAVVDPRFSTAAGKAHYYLPIKPGTDMALLLAWTNVILQEGLYDKEYVEKHGTGLEELKQITANDTPEWAAAITELPAEQIRTVAREMAREKPNVLIHPGRHVTWHGDDTQRSRAIAILNGLLGSWGRKGGFYMASGVDVPPYPAPEYPKSERGAADGSGTRYPLADETLASGLCDATIAGAPYQAKGWLVYGTNLLQSLPDPRRTAKAIENLDFLAVVDILPAEIAGYADVVLPECSYLERYDDLHAGAFRTPFLALRQPVVEPLYDSKPGWWMARELSHRMGLEEYFAWDNIEDYLDTRLKSIGTNLADMKEKGVVTMPAPDGEIGDDHEFYTSSGKIEFHSPLLAQLGHDPVPRYRPHEEPPPGQFRLIFGRSPLHTFGRTTNNPVLSSVVPDNSVWINHRVGESLGLQQGQKIRLVNQDGVKSGPVRTRLTKRIRQDCVYMVHGFGHKTPRMRTNGRGASDSDLVTKYKTDPIMGGTGMFVNFVSVEAEV
jgi:thiosulfate reductase / polysulfide reductase chain A